VDDVRRMNTWWGYAHIRAQLSECFLLFPLSMCSKCSFLFLPLQLVSLTEEVIRGSKKKFLTLLWILGKGLANWWFLYSLWQSMTGKLKVEWSATCFVLSVSAAPSCCQKGIWAFGLAALGCSYVWFSSSTAEDTGSCSSGT